MFKNKKYFTPKNWLLIQLDFRIHLTTDAKNKYFSKITVSFLASHKFLQNQNISSIAKRLNILKIPFEKTFSSSLCWSFVLLKISCCRELGFIAFQSDALHIEQKSKNLWRDFYKKELIFLNDCCFTNFSSQAVLKCINSIHHDVFSHWFIMRELIINSVWIIHMTNSLPIFHVMSAWSYGRMAGYNLQFIRS